ncbi:hypothetical protein CJU90_1113 [Yarrowia sp. C11]|nr:hypothetical protein CKK34_2527 [Yarrowia sp. E02]KAG5373415.1 hypothetical protein CJU90_1113 [Yarrowia sp. C11]
MNAMPVSRCISIGNILRHLALGTKVFLMAVMSDQGVAHILLYTLVFLVASIVPFWTRPKLTLQHIHKMGMSAGQFTAIAQVLSLILLGIFLCSHPVPTDLNGHLTPVATLLLSSLLQNEIKWAPVYFHSHWTPVSKWGERSVEGNAPWWYFAAPVWINSFGGLLFKVSHSSWPFMLTLIMTLLAYARVFMCEKNVDKIDPDGKVRCFISESSEYQPLQWNDPRSYDFYRDHAYKRNKFYFWTYFLDQFL